MGTLKKLLVVCSAGMGIYLPVTGQPVNKPTTATQVGSATAVTAPSSYDTAIRINYVRTKEAIAPITHIDSFNAQTYLKVKEATQYFDGLGRSLQTVMRQVTPGSSPKDLVTPVVYDTFGREVYKYLPYAQVMGSNQDDGRFKLDAFSSQSSFYSNSSYHQNNGLAGENIYYGKTVFETSPLSRPLKTFAPGNSWAGSEGGANEHAVQLQYLVNGVSDSVRVWNITNDTLTFVNNDISVNIPTTSAIYGAGQLYKTVTIDEHGSKVVEYKDKEGKVVLKKVQIDAVPGTGHIGWLCTYYVYDDLGQLRFILSPKAVAYQQGLNSWTLDTTVIKELCFRYEYDSRQRMIGKKVPGAAWVYMVYDKRDRLTYSQDGNMRAKNQWMAMLYDELNRPRITGMITYLYKRTQLQVYVDANFNANSYAPANVVANIPPPEDLYVSQREEGRTEYKAGKTITFTGEMESESTAEFESVIDGSGDNENVGVQNDPIPAGGNFIALTISYYDNYAFTEKVYNTANNSKLDAGDNSFAESLPGTASWNVRGMTTGTRVRVLSNPDTLSQGSWLETVSFYDMKARVVQVQGDNYRSGVDTVTSRYDFTGKVITTYVAHSNQAASVFVRIKTNMNYDHAGRLLNVKKTVNDKSNTERTVARIEYDPLGQLKRKLLGQEVESGVAQTTPMDTLDYEYNIRGWLAGMNKDYAKTGGNDRRWFGMQLNYDWGYDSLQFNGNISGMKWRSKGDGERRDYGFGYDKANRLLFADFNQYTSGTWNKTANVDFSVYMGNGYAYNSAYDENGNILKMQQYGLKINSSAAIDNLNYTYFTGTNKLKKVQDSVTTNNKLGDFFDANTGDDYGYDVNGNMVIDKNKRINGGASPDVDMASANGGIKYNHLNLPWKIFVKDSTGADKGTITYIYDAAGVKLRKMTEEIAGAKITSTDYVSAFVYQNDTLQFFGQEEGRIRTKSTNRADSCYYDYFVKDHLGNVRMVLSDEEKMDIYQAGMETADSTFEQALFSNISETRYGKPTGHGSSFDTDASNHKVALVKGNTAGTIVGPNKLLKVMAGDKFKISVYGMETSEDHSGLPPSGTPILSEIVTQLFSGGVANVGKNGLAYSQLETYISPYVTSFLGGQDTSQNAPHAYLNWILLDEEQLKLVTAGNNSGFVDVPTSTSKTLLQANGGSEIEVTKNGYLFVYVSNSGTRDAAFFDDLRIEHIRGPLVEETHYYPFGLTMEGISSKAMRFGSPRNKYRSNGGCELENKEFEDESGLEWLYTEFRSYDPQIGRFIQIDPLSDFFNFESPYVFVGNNPINFADPLGLSKDSTSVGFPNSKNANDLPPVEIVSKKGSKSSSANISAEGKEFLPVKLMTSSPKTDNAYLKPPPDPTRFQKDPVNKDAILEFLDALSSAVDHGDMITDITETYHEPFVKAGYVLTAVTAGYQILEKKDYKGAAKTVVEAVVAGSKFGPYYYAYKVGSFILTSKFALSQAYFGALADKNFAIARAHEYPLGSSGRERWINEANKMHEVMIRIIQTRINQIKDELEE